MVDVFVSYASEDRDRVKPVVEVLERSGWKVWWDRQIGAGSAFDREIEKAIDQAKCIVVVWSANSVESEWVRTEANEGLERGNLVPIAIETVRPPLAFRRIQTIDFQADVATSQMREAVAKFVKPTSQASGDATPFVGRDPERQRAQELLDEIGDQAGRTLLIGGEVGVGKTRFVRELANLARSKGFLVLTGQCIEMDGAPPYQPLLEQIAQATRVSRPENMRRSLGENAPEVAKLMPELRQQFDDIPETPQLPPDQERRYLLNGVGDFIDRGARVQPMMLVFEDLHWADDSVCILLRHLAQRLKETPVFMVGTYRDEELDTNRPFAGALRDLTRERLVEEFLLKCLDKQGVTQLIEGRARRTPPDELIDLVFAETEGNPFFVEEVYRHLEQSGKLFDASGEFRQGVDIKDTEVPRGVQLVIGERLGRVSEECQSVLAVAAVVGRTFSFDILLKAGGKLTDDDILEAIEEADAAGLIDDQSTRREARYSFVHEQIRQSLLMGLSLPRRQRIHLRVAEGLEELFGDKADEHAAELGYHLYQAGAGADLDRTVHYLTVAGKRAMEALAFEDALRRFDSLLEIVDDDGTELQSGVHRLQAAAYTGMGRIDNALRSYDRALEFAPDGDKDDILLERCRMLLDVWRGSDAVDDLEGLLARRKAGDDREAELEAQHWMARAYYQMSLDRNGYTEKLKQAYDDTIELARTLGNEKTLAHTLIATVQMTDYDRSYRATALKHLEEAEEIGRRLDDEEILIDVATARMGTSFGEESDLLGEEILKRLLARRDPVRLNAHYFRMMWATLAAARLERCIEVCDAGIELASRIGAQPVQYPTIKAMAQLSLGRFDDALASLDDEIADEEHRFGAALKELGRLQYLTDCAAFEEAVELAPHVIAEAKFLSRTWMLDWTARALASCAMYLAENPELLGRAESLIEETGTNTGRSIKAQLAMGHGDPANAISLTKAIEDEHEEPRQVRQHLARIEIRAWALALDGQWQGVRNILEAAVKRAGEMKLTQQFWRLSALLARACRELGDTDASGKHLDAARESHRAIATNISNAAHRQAFVAGGIATQLGVAGEIA